MKATIEIPDDLYRTIKAKRALQGRTVRSVTIELFERWLGEEHAPDSPQPPRQQSLDNVRRLAQETFQDVPPGRTARDSGC